MTDISKEIAEVAPTGGFAGAEYNAVATAAELEGIVLLNCAFQLDPEFLGRRREWRLSYGRKVKSCQFNVEEDSVAGVFEYHVTAKVGRKRAFHCAAEYAVFYATPEGATAEAANAFCKNVGRFAAYPYFRGLAATLAAEANVMLPPLPSIASTAHIPPKPKKQTEEA